MTDALLQLSMFSAKITIVTFFILIIFVAFFALLAKSKDKTKGRLIIKHLNKKYAEAAEAILTKHCLKIT